MMKFKLSSIALGTILLITNQVPMAANANGNSASDHCVYFLGTEMIPQELWRRQAGGTSRNLHQLVIEAFNTIRRREKRPELSHPEVAKLLKMSRGSLTSWLINELNLSEREQSLRLSEIVGLLAELKAPEAIDPIMDHLLKRLKSSTDSDESFPEVDALLSLATDPAVKKHVLESIAPVIADRERRPLPHQIEILRVQAVLGDKSAIPVLVDFANGKFNRVTTVARELDLMERLTGFARRALGESGDPAAMAEVVRLAPPLNVRLGSFSEKVKVLLSWEGLSRAAYTHGYMPAIENLIHKLPSRNFYLEFIEFENALRPKRNESDAVFYAEVLKQFRAGDDDAIIVLAKYYNHTQIFLEALFDPDYAGFKNKVAYELLGGGNKSGSYTEAEYAYYIAARHDSFEVRRVALEILEGQDKVHVDLYERVHSPSKFLMVLWHNETNTFNRDLIERLIRKAHEKPSEYQSYNGIQKQIIEQLADGRISLASFESDERFATLKKIANIPNYQLKSSVEEARTKLLNKFKKALGRTHLSTNEENELLAAYRYGANEGNRAKFKLNFHNDWTPEQLSKKQEMLIQAGYDADKILRVHDLRGP